MRKFSMIPAVIAICTAAAIHSARAETLLYISEVSSGVYEIYNPNTNTSVYVKDVQAYINRKYGTGKVEGFGKSLSEKEFAKGATPVTDAVEEVSRPVNYAAGTAYNAANMVPSWRKYTVPLKAVFGSKSKPKRTGTIY